MGVTIGTNVASLSAQVALSKSQNQMSKSLRALASGSRIGSAGDDAAGYAIAESLKAQIGGIKQGSHNADGATSLVQIAEGSLNEQNNILLRMRELAIQSASDTVSDTEREFMHEEFVQLRSEVDRIARSTRYGSLQLLSGEENRDMQFQVGPYNTENDIITYRLDADTTASTLRVENLGVGSQDDALDSLESIDEALMKVSAIRANFGAIQERLEYAKNANLSAYEGLSEARSRIMDADIAEEASKLTHAQILQSAGVSILAQANMAPNALIKLLG